MAAGLLVMSEIIMNAALMGVRMDGWMEIQEVQCLTSKECSTWGQLLGSHVKCLQAARADLAPPIGGSCT